MSRRTKRGRNNPGEIPRNPHPFQFIDNIWGVGFNDEDHFNCYNALKQHKWVATHWLCSETCDALGIRGELTRIARRFSLEGLFSQSALSHPGWTLEFLATLNFDVKDKRPTINFHLGGVMRDMDMPQLSRVLGLDCDERKFKCSQKDHGKARTAF